MCGRGVLNSYYNIFIVKRRGEKNKKKTAGLANCAFSTKKNKFYKIFTINMPKNQINCIIRAGDIC